MRSKQQYQAFARRTRSAFFAGLWILVVSTILGAGASLAATRAAAESRPELTGLTVDQDGAKVAITDPDVRRSYTLIGDPSMTLR